MVGGPLSRTPHTRPRETANEVVEGIAHENGRISLVLGDGPNTVSERYPKHLFEATFWRALDPWSSDLRLGRPRFLPQSGRPKNADSTTTDPTPHSRPSEITAKFKNNLARLVSCFFLRVFLEGL